MKEIDIRSINGVPIYVELVPPGNKNVRPGNPMTPKYITIHNTGNRSAGADAKMHARYLINQAKLGDQARKASWHFTVDDTAIYQHLPLDENAWHCTDGHGPGNMSSIGIEICEHVDQRDYKKAEENAIALAVYLAKRLNIPVKNIVPHRHWYNKYCPHIILNYGWDKFFNRVLQAYSQQQKTSTIRPVVRPIINKIIRAVNPKIVNPSVLLKRGDQGSAVKEAQEHLRRHGYNIAVDGIFGPKTEQAVRAFQAAKGLVVDGIIGPKTWNELVK